MSFVDLKKIEKTIKQNKEREKIDEKIAIKKEERDKLSVQKLPSSHGAFRFGNLPRIAAPKVPENTELTEWKSGLNKVSINMFVNYCKQYGCDEHVLREELTKSKDIKKVVEDYMCYFDNIPDLGKLGLTLFEKAINAKYNK